VDPVVVRQQPGECGVLNAAAHNGVEHLQTSDVYLAS
jgi:hypothetical protein